MIYLKLFLTFFEIGLFTFGGGYAMIPLIQSQVVGNGWLSNSQLIDFIAVSESTPGPFAVNIATFVGEKTGGVLGSFFATLGVVLPSFIIILIVARFYEKFKASRGVKGVMTGLKPTVVGLIASAVITIGSSVFFSSGLSVAVVYSPSFWCSVVIFVAMLAVEFLPKLKIHPIAIVGLSAVLGIAAGYAFGI